MLFAPRCPHCGTQLFGSGIFGEPSSCECGQLIPASLFDRARRYWAFQAALPYGASTFLLGFALFHAHLPLDPWERMFSPLLISPAIASVVVEYRILMQRMRRPGGDRLLFNAYFVGMVLAGLSLILALIAEKL
jgi:hypothetical protein